MYLPPLIGPEKLAISTWEYRRELLRKRIGMIDADVVCFQEVSPISFEEDFAFMKDVLGYDGVELFKKGRFRPATFWKTSRCNLVVPPVHKDRTLLTSFRIVKEEAVGKEGVDQNQDSRERDQEIKGNGEKMITENNTGRRKKKGNKKTEEQTQSNWHILNSHLQAGREGGRRVRQIHEGVGAAFKLTKKLKEKDPASLRLIVCGDFNGGSECGAVRYLEDGSVDENFLEDGQPVTSKIKSIPLMQPLVDVPDVQGLRRDGQPPPTLVVPELISLMVDGGNGYENPRLSKLVLERLERIYARYATHYSVSDDVSSLTMKQMSVEDVKRWLIDINGQVGRGSEFRHAAKEMGWTEPDAQSDDEEEALKQAPSQKEQITLPPDGVLTLDGFFRVYEAELRRGKFWGIAHDLAVLNEPLPDAGVYKGRLDRMYCSSSLHPVAVMDTICDIPCPNELEPSDHLPVAAAFELN